MVGRKIDNQTKNIHCSNFHHTIIWKSHHKKNYTFIRKKFMKNSWMSESNIATLYIIETQVEWQRQKAHNWKVPGSIPKTVQIFAVIVC